MRTLLLTGLFLLNSLALPGQNQKVFKKAMAQLRSFARKDSARVQGAINQWWDERKKNDQVPLASPDSVAFLYRGTATSVAWMGDFNGWGSKPFKNQGRRIKNTDIWVLTCSFPATARLDYKVVLNGKEWIVDPVNPHQQFSGVGGGMPNSEIHMPGWKRDATQQERTGIPKGTVIKNSITSQFLGYGVAYSIYAPPNSVDDLPTLYVTDGNEYGDPRLGNMQTTLDNLIADQRIRPLRVVFIDARDPGNPAMNRRMSELALNGTFLKFLTGELIPAVEGSKRIERDDRGVLGTSLGGLSAAYFALMRPDLFRRVGIQSPAFWYKPEIFTLAEQVSGPKLKIFMSAGTIYDASAESQKMKAILEKSGHSCKYVEVPEGHSWGNWRNLLDDLLVELYGKK